MPTSPRTPLEGLGGFGRPGQIMALTSTVAGLALGFATETGTEYLNDTLGALASDLVSSGHELVSGNHAPTRYQSQNPRAIPKMASPDSHFLARIPLAEPAQDLALTGALPTWSVGIGRDVTYWLTKHAVQEVSNWIHTDSNLRFYGEPLALLALLGVGGVGSAALSAAFLVAMHRSRSVQSAPVSIQEQALAILADEAFRGNPQNDPIEGHVYNLVTPTARAVGSVTYGGPGSKYNKICEDSMGLVVRADGSLVAFVFDGAGGSGGGFRATSLANQSLIGLTQDCEGSAMPTQDLVAAVLHANTVIYEDNIAQHGVIHNEKLASCTYAYGTVAGVEVSPTNQVTAVGVGDSRVITLRGGKVLDEGTTKLHNYAQELVDKGIIPPEDYYTHPMNNCITKDVGMHQNLEDPSVKVFQARVGDLCVIVSDGIVDVVTPYEIAQLSKKYKTTQALQKAIFDLAYARNQTIRDYTIQLNATTAITMPPRGDLMFPETIMTLVPQAEIDQIIATSNTAEDVRTRVVALADSRRDPATITDTAWTNIVGKIKGGGDNIAVAVVKIVR